MNKLLPAFATVLLLAGCGAAPSPVAAPGAPSADLTAFAAFKESDYKAASYRELSSFWDREGSSANKGKKFSVKGKLHHNAPDNFLEGWGAQISDGKDSNWIIVNKGFFTRAGAERFFEKAGSGTGETVTVYFTVKESSNTKDRIRVDAVKRSNGKVYDL